MTTTNIKAMSGSSTTSNGRWLQLVLGVICMAMIANLQYGWTLFVNPIQQKFHWEKDAIQWAFTIFVLAETWLVPLEGYLVDKFGPKPLVIGGGLMVGVAWVMNSQADTLNALYLAAAIGGVGAGAVYGTCVGNALKWFPDRRGLAAGVTAMGFGAGSALTVVPIADMIKTSGYEQAFLVFGVGQGVIVFFLGMLLRQPSAEYLMDHRVISKALVRHQFTPREMLKTPVFWVMYLMFVMMAAGGLMAVAQLGPIAKDLAVGDAPVTLAGVTLPALAFALTIDRVLNGASRPFFGWVSDKIGRENTMFLAFAAEGAGIILLAQFGRDPVLFVILSGVVFFAWGEIYSLFPAACGDSYGSKFAAANAGLLYTAKGTAALIIPYTSQIAKAGHWDWVFYGAAGLNFAAALLAIVVLKPLRRSLAQHSS